MVVAIDNLLLARIARLAGAPKVQGAGVDLLYKLGERVEAGAPLYRVYAAYPADLEFARQASQRNSGFTLGSADELPHLYVEF
ncbi:thymidine phosphorylase [compost metagenome]